MPSTRSLKGLMSKEWASMSSGIMALMVEPLSKGVQLLSSSILTWAMFSGPHQWVSRSGFNKGALWDVLRLKEPHPEMLAEWLLVSEGPSLPSLSSPLLHFDSLSGWSYSGLLDNPLWDGQGYHIWKKSTTLAKWTIYLTNWSAPPTPLEISMSSPPEDLASSSPSGFMPESSLASLFSTVVDWAVKVWLLFSFWEGNKFPGIWEWVIFDLPAVVVLYVLWLDPS